MDFQKSFILKKSFRGTRSVTPPVFVLVCYLEREVLRLPRPIRVVIEPSFPLD